jgi:hypothetical protein
MCNERDVEQKSSELVGECAASKDGSKHKSDILICASRAEPGVS